VEYGCFQFSIPELDQASGQVDAISISLLDVSKSVVVQIRLRVSDSALFPDDELLTTVVGLPQNANKNGLGRNAEDAFCLYVFALAQESGCFSQDTRQTSLAV